jgi:hypothetical protein
MSRSDDYESGKGELGPESRDPRHVHPTDDGSGETIVVYPDEPVDPADPATPVVPGRYADSPPATQGPRHKRP